MGVLCAVCTELSRRDDLESLAYCFIYFLTGKLPWQGLKAPNRKKKYELILETKTTMPPEVLCRGLPGERVLGSAVLRALPAVPISSTCNSFTCTVCLPAEFCTFLKYARHLRFDEQPDYAHLRQLFKDLFFRSGYR
jgi:casein kinase I family protein HRR25